MNDKLTIKDIARLSGVGISTVSRVVNGRADVGKKTRERVMEVVRREGYVPNNNAKHLKLKSSNYIAVIIRGMQNLFLTSIVERVQACIEQQGYGCLLTYIDERDDEFAQASRIHTEKKVLGIIFLGGDTTGRLQDIRAIGVPCVFTTTEARGIDLPNVSSVGVDDRAAAYSAISYLFQNGHRDIAVVGGELECENNIGLRYKGVTECYSDHGLTFDEGLYITSTFSFQNAYDGVCQVLQSGRRFTAVFAMSDSMAIGASKAITDSGLSVPGDISIVGFDGTDMARFYTPSITSVKQPRGRLAEMSVKLLVDTLERSIPGTRIRMETSLMEGGSVRDITQDKLTDS